MAAFKIRQTVDLNSPGPQKIEQAHGHVGDKKAHEWEVKVVRGGAPVDLTGYSALALVNNGVGTVNIVATITGNVASAVFPAACYTEGVHKCFMRITNASEESEAITATMHLNVVGSETDNPVDGGTGLGETLSGLLASEAARVSAEEERAAFYDGFNSQLAAKATKTEAAAIQSQIDVLVVEGDSSVEAAQARVNTSGHTFDSLRARLDGVDSVVSRIDVSAGKEALSKRQRKPMMTFVDDDGHDNFLLKWPSIISDKSVPVTCCVPTEFVGKYSNTMSWAEIESLPALGVEVISHGHEHVDLRGLTEGELESQFSQSKDLLRAHGIDTNFIAYPFGYANALTKSVASRYFRGGIGAYPGGSAINVPPIASFSTLRYPLGNASYDYTLPALKARVDEAVAQNGWLIWMSHAEYDSFDETQLGYVREMIDYARSLGVEIVSLEQGYNRIGNVVESGEAAGEVDYFAVSCDGEVRFRHKKTGINSATPATSFPPRQLVTHSFYSGENSGFPDSGTGTLWTYYDDVVSVNSFQLWFPIGSNNVHKRRWLGSEWESFVIVSHMWTYLETAVNYASYNTPVSSFRANAITYSYVNSTGGSGFPSFMGAGILITYRFSGGGNGYDRQEYTGYKQNRKWMRFTDVDGSWTPFIEIGGGAGTTANRPKFGIDVGYSYYDTTLNKPAWLKTAWVREVDTLTVTAGASASGNITITLNGVAVTVAVTAGMTVAQVDAAIRAATYTGWILTGAAGSGVVGFNKSIPGACSAPSFDAASTGVAATFARTTSGVDGVWVDATGTTA